MSNIFSTNFHPRRPIPSPRLRDFRSKKTEAYMNEPFLQANGEEMAMLNCSRSKFDFDLEEILSSVLLSFHSRRRASSFPVD
jgi:hypothetical protein